MNIMKIGEGKKWKKNVNKKAKLAKAAINNNDLVVSCLNLSRQSAYFLI